jgi:hypothetical protein
MTTQKYQIKSVYKLAIPTLLLLMVSMPIFSFIHEQGHVQMCEFNGRDSAWGMGLLTGAWSSCSGKFEDPTSFRLVGGLLSASIALIFYIGLKPILKGKLKAIGIVLVTIALTQFVNAILEGFANDFYMNSEYSSLIAGLIMFIVPVVLIFSNSKLTDKEVIEVIETRHEVPQSIFQRSLLDIFKKPSRVGLQSPLKTTPIRALPTEFETDCQICGEIICTDDCNCSSCSEGYLDYEEDEGESN